MRKWAVLFFMLFLTGAVWANPVIYPSISDGGYFVVLVSASVVEVSLVALILFCFDFALKPVWMALFVGNMIIYYMIFLPLLDAVSSLLIVEGLIVAADGILIKTVSLFDIFQQQTFKGLRWKYAFLIAAIGNIVSYYLGSVIQG
jgi:hypothetical protein